MIWNYMAIVNTTDGPRLFGARPFGPERTPYRTIGWVEVCYLTNDPRQVPSQRDTRILVPRHQLEQLEAEIRQLRARLARLTRSTAAHQPPVYLEP